MKNVFLYLNPKGISENADKLVKVQIENILLLGWDPKDIIFITNFPYEFMGVKATEVPSDYFFSDDPASTKCYTLSKMFEKNQVFNDEELYWVHDIDHFQQLPFDEEEIVREMGESDFALCNYGRRVKLNCGSIFFRKSAADIYAKIRDIMVDCRQWSKRCEEERALMIMMTNNRNWAFRSSIGAENSFAPYTFEDMSHLSKRVHIMPITYNFADYNMTSLWKMCGGNPKTAHFNPFPEQASRKGKDVIEWKLPFFLGENKLRRPLINERLINLFKQNGIITTGDVSSSDQ
jgi:hypothetical protein